MNVTNDLVMKQTNIIIITIIVIVIIIIIIMIIIIINIIIIIIIKQIYRLKKRRVILICSGPIALFHIVNASASLHAISKTILPFYVFAAFNVFWGCSLHTNLCHAFANTNYSEQQHFIFVITNAKLLIRQAGWCNAWLISEATMEITFIFKIRFDLNIIYINMKFYVHLQVHFK